MEIIQYSLKDRRSFRNMANRARERSFPRNPRNHTEIDFSLIGLEHLQLGRCAHADPEVKNKDVFLFGTPLTAEAFAKAEFKSGDGTFKICPKLFYQVFVLMALYGGIYVPCLFGLLPDKTEDSYIRLFGMIWAYNDKNNLPNNFENQFFMCDFERAIRSSFLLYWPHTRVLGCYFHFSQCVWKKVKKNGFQNIYEKHDQFNALVRRMSALPFAPKEALDEAFKIFKNRTEEIKDREIKEFCYELIEYLADTWRNGSYALQDWNISDINLMVVPATNNGQEGSNRRFGEDFGTHPSLWSFMLTMNEELETSDNDIRSILFGTKVPANNEMYTFLKEERERVKANYKAGLVSLDELLGKLGALSIKTAKQKVASDIEPIEEANAAVDRRRKSKRKASNYDSDMPKTKRGRRGRLPSLAQSAPTSSSSSNAAPVIASSNMSQNNLPWPSVGDLMSNTVLPATAARTGGSTGPLPHIQPSLRTPAIYIDTSIGSNDSLLAHISKYKLGKLSKLNMLVQLLSFSSPVNC